MSGQQGRTEHARIGAGRAFALALIVASLVMAIRVGAAAWGFHAGRFPFLGAILDTLTPAAAALLMAHASWRLRRRAGRLASAWAFLAWAYAAYAAAELLGVVVGKRVDASTVSLVALAHYLSFYPLFLIGVLRFGGAALGRRERRHLLLDMGIVMIGAGLVIWTLLVRPALESGGPSPVRVFMTLAYPGGDLAVLWALLSLVLLRRERPTAGVYGLLAASAAAMIVTDLAYGYHLLHPRPFLAQAIDPGWVIGHLLAGIAAVRQLLGLRLTEVRLAPASPPWRQSRASLHLAHTCLLGGLLVLLVAHRDAVGVIGGLAALAMIALVVARQLTWVAANERLAGELRLARDTLERRVEERTAELAALNRWLTAEVEVRTVAERRAELQVERLAALREIDTAITGSLDLRVTIGVFLDKVMTQLRVDAARILLLDPISQTLEVYAERGLRTPSGSAARLQLGEGHAGRAAMERHAVCVPDLGARANGNLSEAPYAGEGFRGCCASPLIAKAQVKGVLEVFTRAPLGADAEWHDFLLTLAGQAAIAIDNTAMFDRTQRANAELAVAYEATLEGWSRALELRDYETQGHTLRVAAMTVRVARASGMGEDELIHVRRGALLHDIGKMGIPDTILLKPGPLTDEEWEVMRRHPVYAFDLLSHIAYLRPALDIPYCHHEHYDGSGYPRGLKGAEIPLAARIFAVVDNWDALLFDRPYRSAWPADRVRRHIQDHVGTLFDPAAATSFLACSR